MQLTKGMPSALVGAWGGDTLPPAPFAQEVYLTHFPIAGAYYVEGGDLVKDMRAGDTLNLLREPENEHDTHAIKVVDAAQKKARLYAAPHEPHPCAAHGCRKTALCEDHAGRCG